MSWKDQTRRRRAAEKRGRRGNRRANAMLLRALVVHPVSGTDATGFVVDDLPEEKAEALARIKSGLTEEGLVIVGVDLAGGPDGWLVVEIGADGTRRIVDEGHGE